MYGHQPRVPCRVVNLGTFQDAIANPSLQLLSCSWALNKKVNKVSCLSNFKEKYHITLATQNVRVHCSTGCFLADIHNSHLGKVVPTQLHWQHICQLANIIAKVENRTNSYLLVFLALQWLSTYKSRYLFNGMILLTEYVRGFLTEV